MALTMAPPSPPVTFETSELIITSSNSNSNGDDVRPSSATLASSLSLPMGVRKSSLVSSELSELFRIESVAYPGYCIYMDCSDMPPDAPMAERGGGIVGFVRSSGEPTTNDDEKIPSRQENRIFLLKYHDDGSLSFESNKWPGKYLRMALNRVGQRDTGTINCQHGAYAWEKFVIERHNDGTVSFRNKTFDAYLAVGDLGPQPGTRKPGFIRSKDIKQSKSCGKERFVIVNLKKRETLCT